MFPRPLSLDQPGQAPVRNHRLVAKAWAEVGSVTGTPAIRDSENVASISNNGTGRMGVNWDRDFSSANYCVTGSSGEDTPGAGNATKTCYDGDSKGAASCELNFYDNNNTLRDPDDFSVVAFGTQSL